MANESVKKQPASKYTPKPVNPPNGRKTVDSSNPATKIPMRPVK